MKVLRLIPVENLHSPLSMIRTDHLELLFVGDFSKSPLKDHISLSLILFCFNLPIYLSYHTLLKALDKSRNTSLTSMALLEEVKILRVIDRSWFTQESPGLNPDCLGEIWLSEKYFNFFFFSILNIYTVT